jgi:asparagine synthase (glutamine-hydrolysing)
MCGIAGFTRPDRNASTVLRRMMAEIEHRGPDDDGVWIDDQIAVGHQRLTIIEPVGGDQPRLDPVTGDLLVFNGEIYNYKDHAAALRDAGVRLRDDSDTEVLFQMIRLHGVGSALRRLDGMFAFAYRDGASDVVTLARDRFGEKPLFYAVIAGQLVFASEIKALRKHPLCVAADFDIEAIGQYLTFDYVPAPRTGFAGIKKLMPAHLLIFNDGEIEIEAYWDLPAGDPTQPSADMPATETEAIDRLDTLLRESIKSRLVADVPVGVFLSGGIDSALIAAITADYAPGISAYTIKMPGDGYDETPIAARVADRFGLRHEVRTLTDADVLYALDRVEAKQDEPFADPSIVPTYLLSETAAQGVKVALGGDGGDELFAGYINFQARKAAAFMSHLPPLTGKALRKALSVLPPSDRYMALPFKLAQLSQGFGQSEYLQSFLWMAPFDADARRALLCDDVPIQQSLHPVSQWVEQHPSRGPVDRLQRLFSAFYLPDDILTKVDRASMYNSLEVRAPYLSEDIAAFAFAMPERWRVNGYTTKYLLRRLAARYLPDDVVARRKHGFAIPVSGLMRGPLRDRVSDVLLDVTNPIAGLFDRTEVERLLSAHMDRREDHRKRLWSLYCLFRFAAGTRASGLARAA